LGVKLGLSQQEENTDWGCMRTGCEKKIWTKETGRLEKTS